jgi:hypothetical protein
MYASERSFWTGLSKMSPWVPGHWLSDGRLLILSMKVHHERKPDQRHH